MPRLAAHHISIDLNRGWEGRIAVRRHADPLTGRPIPEHPIVHLANFGLPADRGDWGSGAVDIMTERNVFVTLFEFGPESVGTELFRAQGMPRPRASHFRPEMLQRRIPGQLGYQRFFTYKGRAFSLYVVAGGIRRLEQLTSETNDALDRVRIEAP